MYLNNLLKSSIWTLILDDSIQLYNIIFRWKKCLFIPLTIWDFRFCCPIIASLTSVSLGQNTDNSVPLKENCWGVMSFGPERNLKFPTIHPLKYQVRKQKPESWHGMSNAVVWFSGGNSPELEHFRAEFKIPLLHIPAFHSFDLQQITSATLCWFHSLLKWQNN